eukprot:TRINITY_DN12148_c0_g1_i1.p1 TRINITY_DN12148_c0_g1~~TRINITY_DN12148_c0_g1_i1.p1  ORF type:complete len:529 (-),score=123.59 TRINITY_DN12148_c0_g1_i1:181-1767(-)
MAEAPPSTALAMAYGATLDVQEKNVLFVSNLSERISETLLRESFEPSCGPIDEVVFKFYPGSLRAYAQIAFRTSKGVQEGSKLGGTNILGTAIECSVVDPTSFAVNEAIALQKAREEAREDPQAQVNEWHEKLRKVGEARLARTVHLAGLPDHATLEGLRQLCSEFGEVEQLRLDVDKDGKKFGLVQFAELSTVRVCTFRRTFLVDDCVVVVSQAKTEVDVTDIKEASVEFRHYLVDRVGQGAQTSAASSLSQQGGFGSSNSFWEQLAKKQQELYSSQLQKVRTAAEDFLGPDAAPSSPPAASDDSAVPDWVKDLQPPPEVLFEMERKAAAEAEERAKRARSRSRSPSADPLVDIDRYAEPDDKAPLDLEDAPDIVGGSELAVVGESSEDSEASDASSAIEEVGGQYADGPKAQRARRAALRAARQAKAAARQRRVPGAQGQRVPPKPQTPAQFAAAKTMIPPKPQTPAQFAAARARAVQRLQAKATLKVAPAAEPRKQRKRRADDGIELLGETVASAANVLLDDDVL